MITYTAEQAMHLKRQHIGFHIYNKPAPSYVFLHFINPVKIEQNGKFINTASNACILYSPGANLNYCAEKIDLFHDFLHFNVSDEESFRKLGLPLDTIFYTNLQTEITEAVEMVETCMVKKFPSYPEKVNHTITDIFSRLIEEQRHQISISGGSDRYRFNELRTLIFQSPKDWSIPKMAQYVNLSRSRFSTKYHALFNVSPIEELTSARLIHANRLLSTTDMPIGDIAYECGFTGPDYFIRLYKKTYDITPGAYRKKMKETNIP